MELMVEVQAAMCHAELLFLSRVLGKLTPPEELLQAAPLQELVQGCHLFPPVFGFLTSPTDFKAIS